MCSIVGSKYPNRVLELIKENSYRGEFSYSFTLIDTELNLHTIRDFGSFNKEMFLKKCSEINSIYIICHCQAPTGGLVKDFNRIHPIVSGKYRLLHNGILKQKWVDAWKLNSPSNTDFDTFQFVNYLEDSLEERPLEDALYSVDGSYACVLMTENDFPVVFRNDSSVLHFKQTNTDIELSSHKVDGFEPLKPYTINVVNLRAYTLEQIGNFKSVNMPFYFG